MPFCVNGTQEEMWAICSGFTMYVQGITCAAHGSMGSDGYIWDWGDLSFITILPSFILTCIFTWPLHFAFLPTLDFCIYRQILVKDEAESFVYLGNLSIGFLSLYFYFLSPAVSHNHKSYFQFYTPFKLRPKNRKNLPLKKNLQTFLFSFLLKRISSGSVTYRPQIQENQLCSKCKNFQFFKSGIGFYYQFSASKWSQSLNRKGVDETPSIFTK